MRGLFFIMKGKYSSKAKPSFTNDVTGNTTYIGGYNPESEDTEEWYMLMDKETFHCVACGGSLKKVLDSVKSVIVRYKGEAKLYFRHVSKVTSDDYYETHYLGHKELTPEQRAKKAQGRCPRVSPPMRFLYSRVLDEYGDFFSEDIEEMEDLAYETLKDNTPVRKSKKLMAKTKVKNNTTEMIKKPTLKKKEEKVLEKPKKLIKPKKKFGFKKLSME